MIEIIKTIRAKAFLDEAQGAQLPSRAHSGDAGYDLYSTEGHWIKPNERRLIGTGISLAIPRGYYGRIAPRSGLAYKYGLDVMAGVIDSGYRGEIKVLLINLGETTYAVEKGDRIAQIIFEKCQTVDFQKVTEEDLSVTSREDGGFGSSGE